MAVDSAVKTGWRNTWRVLPGGRRAIHEARQDVLGAVNDLYTKVSVNKGMEAASRDLNNAVHDHRVSEGKLGASIREMFRKFGEALGMDAEKFGSTKLPGENPVEGAEKLLQKARKTHGGVVERALSKPFRMAAKSPRLAMFTLASGAAALLFKKFHSNAQARSEAELQQSMAEAEAAAYRAQQDGQVSYMNSVSPEESARLEAQMRSGGTPIHAANVIAAREAAAPAPEAAIA